MSRFPLMGIGRLRMATDGVGVTTLAAAWGCPLRCKMCLNPHCFSEDTPVKRLTPQELYDRIKIDDLYFQATGGGVTFGGGEPLLHSDFISEFRLLCGSKWHITAETCLNIPQKHVETASECVDAFFIDIKDMNPEIYRSYTGRENDQIIANLEFLLKKTDPDRITVRVPNIPGYNTPDDVQKSADMLRAMGFIHLDIFTYITKK